MDDFSRILLVSDYDRTLTGFDGAVPPANVAALRRFLAAGGAFTVATGRSRPMFRAPVAGGIPRNAPVILSNGGALWQPETDRLTVRCQLPPEALAAVREIHGRFPGLRLELQGTGRHVCLGRDDLRDAYLARYGVAADYGGWDAVDEPVLAACLYAPFRGPGHVRPDECSRGEEAPFEAVEALVRAQYAGLLQPVRSMPRMIELLPVGCGKGGAARDLAERMGRPVLLCAGDAPNDLTMLEAADEAFIPATADPGVRGRGFTEVCGCDEGAVAGVVALLENRM